MMNPDAHKAVPDFFYKTPAVSCPEIVLSVIEEKKYAKGEDPLSFEKWMFRTHH